MITGGVESDAYSTPLSLEGTGRWRKRTPTSSTRRGMRLSGLKTPKRLNDSIAEGGGQPHIEAVLEGLDHLNSLIGDNDLCLGCGEIDVQRALDIRCNTCGGEILLRCLPRPWLVRH